MVNHLNYGNHLGYDSVLTIIQEGRMRWLKTNGMTELSLEGSVGYLITHASVDYQGEGFYGDQLRITLYTGAVSRKGFELKYEVKNETTGKVIATAETRHVCFDFGSRKIASCPEKFRILIAVEDGVKLPPRQ